MPLVIGLIASECSPLQSIPPSSLPSIQLSGEIQGTNAKPNCNNYLSKISKSGIREKETNSGHFNWGGSWIYLQDIK